MLQFDCVGFGFHFSMDGQSSSRGKGFVNARAGHRARSHHSAHADGGLDAAPAIEAHPLVPQGAAEVIADDAALGELIAHLRAAGQFAYDSEFIGELTYFPKLCLIQVASTSRIGLIDPLAELDLTPFWDLLADSAVEKIVHAGQQDIEPVIRNLGRPAKNFFDAQVAAGLAGLPYPLSLSKLVVATTGVKLGKGLTFTHWDQRPLSAIQLRYAADDVRYLPRVRAELGDRLDRLGHFEWAKEECESLCDTTLFRFDPQTQYLRVRGASSLQPRNLAVLRELTAWRDEAARSEDVPPRTFLRDEVLLDLARNPVKSVDRLAKIRGLPRPVESTHGSAIVEATARAFAVPTDGLPAPKEPDATAEEKFRAEGLWALAQALCAGQSMDPALVASRQEIGELARILFNEPTREDHSLLQGWRRQALGHPLREIIAGRSSPRLAWSAGNLSIALTS
ncbi:MAG TPA: HRDC domain-containing protein [Tepidisphaeraceae bacterium]|nr:HRDC domain-containing protein [Tepidisphaeraceae bacterium]